MPYFMGAAIHFRAAVALAGRYPVLAGVDLDVAPGEVVLLTGPNGAGKTSLLRACAGLLAVSAGEARVLGHDLCRDRRSVRRSVAMLGHANFLYDDLTVADNVRFAVRAARAKRSAVDPALARLGLDGRLRNTVVGRLSAGQRRRVAIAALAAREPELWLLDEPHAGLDAAGRDVLDEVVQSAAASGGTVLMASHETDRASGLAQRAVRMAGGQVVGEASLSGDEAASDPPAADARTAAAPAPAAGAGAEPDRPPVTPVERRPPGEPVHVA